MNTGEIILLVLGAIIIVLAAKGKPLGSLIKEKWSWWIEGSIVIIVMTFLIGIATAFEPVCIVSFLIIMSFFMVIIWEIRKTL